MQPSALATPAPSVFTGNLARSINTHLNPVMFLELFCRCREGFIRAKIGERALHPE